MKHRILALFLALCLCLPLAACGKKQGYDPLEGVETRVITDSAGEQVTIPSQITRIAGLIAAAVCLCISTVRRRWYSGYMADLETLLDCVTEMEREA